MSQEWYLQLSSKKKTRKGQKSHNLQPKDTVFCTGAVGFWKFLIFGLSKGKGKNHNKQFILSTTVCTAVFKLLINPLIYSA